MGIRTSRSSHLSGRDRWSVYILAHGISKTHNASYGSAISAAAVLVGISSFLLGLL